MLYIVATSPHRRTISVLWRGATVFSLGAQLAKPFKSQKEQFLMHSISYTLHGDFHSEVLRETLSLLLSVRFIEDVLFFY